MADPQVGPGRMTWSLGDAEADVRAALDDWQAVGKPRRLWDRDAALWTGADEGKWLGWLRSVEALRADLGPLRRIAEDVRAGGFAHALLLGMGGSSLCPEVLRTTFGTRAGFPDLAVLDSTVPAQVRAAGARIDPARTVFIVSSKSGSTLETNVLRQYCHEQVERALGAEPAGRRFVAVTDPGTKMQRIAEDLGFRHIAPGDPEIGGRFSALSNFGMVPAAIMGLDYEDFLARAAVMVRACGPDVPARDNPGVQLGAILATLARRHGRDKVTLVASPPIGRLGAWLEQLIAESTGKQGQGLVPVADEALGLPETYGDDRVFVATRLATAPSAEQDALLAALERAGHPVVRIELAGPMDLGQEFFRWEFATAVAGAILGINPFDQPDVEASKVKTRELAARYAESRQVADEAPIAAEGGLRLFTDAKNAAALGRGDLRSVLAAHLGRIRPGDYFAINAYVEMNDANERLLQDIRNQVRFAKQVATTLGFGPRFLHSTGQLHKGGPDSGVFLQVTAEVAEDLPIPGEAASFGLLNRFQALGDFGVLSERGRRALRVHLGPDVPAGLEALRGMIEQARPVPSPPGRG